MYTSEIHSMTRSPIRWVGGKRRFRKEIIAALPEEHGTYVEPFAGASWVLFGKPPSNAEILSDVDGELVNFFQVVKEEPEALIASFDLVLASREEFERLAGADTAGMTEIERAHRFFYLIMAGWGGEIGYPRFQTGVKDKGHGNRLIGAMKTLRSRIEPASRRLQGVEVEHLHWRDCVAKHDRRGAVMYLDPPYPGNGVNYAYNMRGWEAHEEMAAWLERAKCQWLLSSYDNARVRRLYEGFWITPVETFSGMAASGDGGSRVKNKEVLVSNYEPMQRKTKRRAGRQVCLAL